MSILEAISPTLRELGQDYCPVHPTMPLVQINGACSGLKCPVCTYQSIETSYAATDSAPVRPTPSFPSLPSVKNQKKKGGGKMKGITSQSGQWRVHAILAHNKTQCGLAIAECQEDIGPVNCGRCLKCLRRQLRSARRKLNGRRLKRGQLTFSVL